MKKTILILVAALFTIVSCKKAPDEPGGNASAQFIETMTMEGLFANNVAAFAKDMDVHQQSVNVGRLMYTLQTDDQSQYLKIKLNSNVGLGESTTIICQVGGVFGFLTSGTTYPVELVQIKDGLAWYWNAEQAIGFVIPKF